MPILAIQYTELLWETKVHGLCTSATHPCTDSSIVQAFYYYQSFDWRACPAMALLWLKQVLRTLHFYIHICAWSKHHISVHLLNFRYWNQIQKLKPTKKAANYLWTAAAIWISTQTPPAINMTLPYTPPSKLPVLCMSPGLCSTRFFASFTHRPAHVLT